MYKTPPTSYHSRYLASWREREIDKDGTLKSFSKRNKKPMPPKRKSYTTTSKQASAGFGMSYGTSITFPSPGLSGISSTTSPSSPSRT